jgi:hypothetical protein
MRLQQHPAIWAIAELEKMADGRAGSVGHEVSPLRLRAAWREALRCIQCAWVDDLHHMDAASVELLCGVFDPVAEGSARWLLTSRTQEVPEAIQHWIEQSASDIEIVTLSPLPPQDVAELLHGLGLPEPDIPEWLNALHGPAGGHPLFILEALRQHYLSPITNGRRSIAVDSTSARRLAQQRLRHLGAEARQLKPRRSRREPS